MLAGDWQIFGQSVLQSMIDTFNNKNGTITNPSIASTNKSMNSNTNASNQLEKKSKISTKMTLETVKTAKNTKFLMKKNSITSTHKESHLQKL